MKWIIVLMFSALCVCLLLFSEVSLRAASDALVLCGTRVVPALFPFYVAASMLYEGIVRGGKNKLSRPMGTGAFCWLLGAVSGYPTGARLCRVAGCMELAAFCNLCSPVFIIGVAANGFLGNGNAAAPILLAHYAASLLDGLVTLPRRKGVQPQNQSEQGAAPRSLAEILAEGALAMVRVSGCVVFFSVCSAMAANMMPGGALTSALLSGILEMTIGCRDVAALAVPLRLKIAWISGFISFGGCSVFLQAVGVAKIERKGRYLAEKLFQGCCAFWIAYLLSPTLCPDAAEAMFVSVDQLAENAASLTALALSVSVGIIFVYLLATFIRRTGCMPA